MAKQLFQSLQVFRGLAALAVVCLHTAHSTYVFSGLPVAICSIFSFGHYGVDFFFILSGFIIMYSHMDNDHSISSVNKYIIKRLARIFPAYLPISIGLIVLYAIMPGFSASGGREVSLWSSFLLIPSNQLPALNVAWTLIHEMLFYLFFLTFFASERIFILSSIIWVITIIIANMAMFTEGWLSYPFSTLNLDFLMGVYAAWSAKSIENGPNPKFLILLGLAVSVIMMAIISPGNATWYRPVLGMGLALIVVGFINMEKARLLPWPRLFLLLGSASYSIYLIHTPLLSVMQRCALMFHFHWLFSMIAGVSISLVAGLIYFQLIEKPSSNLFQQQFRSK